jgi:hypothetical protein
MSTAISDTRALEIPAVVLVNSQLAILDVNDVRDAQLTSGSDDTATIEVQVFCHSIPAKRRRSAIPAVRLPNHPQEHQKFDPCEFRPENGFQQSRWKPNEPISLPRHLPILSRDTRLDGYC